MDPFFALKSRLKGDIYVKPELQGGHPTKHGLDIVKDKEDETEGRGSTGGSRRASQSSPPPPSSHELAAKGHRDDTDHPYLLSLALFNKAIRSQAMAVIRPRSVQDVVETVKFVRERGYTISVKGGGHGTAGWAVEGEIVVDLCQMTRIDIAMNAREDMAGDDVEMPVAASADMMTAGARAPQTGRFDHGEMASFKEETLSRAETEHDKDDPLVNLPPDITSPGSSPGSSSASSSSTPDSGSFSAPRLSSASSRDEAAMPDLKQKRKANPDGRRRRQGLPQALADLGPGAAEAFRQGHHLVSFQTGIQSRAVDQASSQFGLHTPLGAYPVGTAECVTGGFGFLARKYGLSIDNLVEVQLVTADGQIVRCSQVEEPDLFWAMHGAGTTMGIITRITSKAYPITHVYSGNMIFPFNPATAASLMAHWRDCVKNVPNELYTNLILTAGPPTPQRASGGGGGGGGLIQPDDPSLTKKIKLQAKEQANNSVIIIQVCFLGPQSQGESIVQAILAWSGERCLLKDVEMRSFMEQQDSVANVLRSGAGQRFFIISDLIDSMTEKLIAGTVKQFCSILPGCAWLFELAGGAVAEVGDATPISLENRQAKFTLVAIHQWKDPNDDAFCIDSARDWLHDVVKPQSTGGPYPCFLERLKPYSDFSSSSSLPTPECEFQGETDEATTRLRGCFGRKNLDRLQGIKNRVDVDNLFRFTFGLSPYRDQAEEGHVEASSSS